MIIIAGNYAQARDYAREQGWSPQDWHYASRPEQLYGYHGEPYVMVGTWWDHPYIERMIVAAVERSFIRQDSSARPSIVGTANTSTTKPGDTAAEG